MVRKVYVIACAAGDIILAGECCSVLAVEPCEGLEQVKFIFPRGFTALASRGGSVANPGATISPATQVK